MNNIPKVKVGIVAVSRDCFPESLSVNRRKALVAAYTEKYDAEDIYECPVCIVESEIHMEQALADIKSAGCNALCVYLGNFGPEIAETMLAACSMKYQKIMARSLPVEVTNGTIEGDITFFLLQSTADEKLLGYIDNGEVLPVATRSFGSIGVFAIPEIGRFYRHVLIEKNYPHHGAVAFGHHAKALYEVFRYVGVFVGEIGYNQPKGVRYPPHRAISGGLKIF